MKLTLLSSMAMITAGLAGLAAKSPAQAEEDVRLGLGGYYASAADLRPDAKGEATKIIYFSPTFGGFNFVVSSAANREGEDSHRYWSEPVGATFSNDLGQVQDAVSVALEFDGDLTGLSLTSGVGFGKGQEENPIDQAETSWGAKTHLDLNYAGFTLGGSMAYLSNDTIDGAGSGVLIYGLGATYNWELWTVGLSWSRGAYEYTSSKNDDDLDIVQFTGRYDLGSGISLDAMVGVNNPDTPSGSSRSDDTAWQAGMGFYIGF
jgi:outer membrane protein OmpU